MTEMFHGTSLEKLDSIQKSGLLRFPPSRVWDRLSRNCVYLTSNVGVAWIWARCGASKVVLKVEVPEYVVEHHIRPDRNVEPEDPDDPECFECWADIPASHIFVGVGKTGQDWRVDFSDWIPLTDWTPDMMEGE